MFGLIRLRALLQCLLKPQAQALRLPFGAFPWIILRRAKRQVRIAPARPTLSGPRPWIRILIRALPLFSRLIGPAPKRHQTRRAPLLNLSGKRIHWPRP